MSQSPTLRAPCLVIVPTLRERQNIARLQQALERLSVPCELLVIDDASDDGTAEWLRERIAQGAAVSLISRPARLGLGTAYTLAVAYAQRCGYRHIVQMDADFSHDPADVVRLVEASERADVVIGSRYVPGGGAENWPWYRHLISRLANLPARWAVGGGLQDVTGGFRCMRGDFARRVPLEQVLCHGFGWQWEFNRLARRAGGRVIELPIRFHQRRAGSSKLTLRIAMESLWRLVTIRSHRPERSRTSVSAKTAAP